MKTDPQEPVRAWDQLVQFVVGPDNERDGQAALALAMSLGAAIADGSTACSVTQVASSGYRTRVSSDPVAIELDRAQYEHGEGPCIAAARDGQPHAISVMADEPRYPLFTSAAVERGVACSLSIPLATGAVSSALNLYARTTHAYDSDRTRATAELLARCVGLLLAEEPMQPNPGLGAALERRALIKRAEAELIRQGCDDETEAYLRMTQLSRRENRSIFAVAADLVASGPAPEPEPRPGEKS